MAISTKWLPLMKINLLDKLQRYLRLVEYVEDKSVIFSSRPKIWKVDGPVCPVIITDLLATPMPSMYSHRAIDVTRLMANFYKHIIPKKTSVPVRVIIFQFQFGEDDISEVHIVFSRDRSLLTRPVITYLKYTSEHEFKPIRIRQCVNNESNEESFWRVEGLPPTTKVDEFWDIEPANENEAERSSTLSEELKKNLNLKLMFFKISSPLEYKHGAIFTSEKGHYWPETLECKPAIRLNPLPPTPPDFQSRSFAIVREILDYVKEEAKRIEFESFYAACSVEGMLESQIHLLFSVYPHPVETTSIVGYPSIGFSPSDPPSLGSASSTPGLEIETSVEMRQRTPSDSAASRLSAELKENLEEKTKTFLKYTKVPSMIPWTAVIFDKEPYFWPEGMPLCQIEQPRLRLPPKSDYDYDKFDIERDILDYVTEMAKAKSSAPFFASTCRFGEGASAEIHLLFTNRIELMTLTSRAGHPSTCGLAPTLLPAVYRHWELKEGIFFNIPSFTTIERKIESSTVAAVSERGVALDDDITKDIRSTDVEGQRLQEIKLRLGHRLREHLSGYIREFKNRTKDQRHLAIVFTDDEDLWGNFITPIVKISQLPPIPPYYDHEKFKIVSDMAEYIVRMTAPNFKEEPVWVTTLSHGAKGRTEVHFHLSPFKEVPKRYEPRPGLQPSPPPPSETISAPTTNGHKLKTEVPESSQSSPAVPQRTSRMKPEEDETIEVVES